MITSKVTIQDTDKGFDRISGDLRGLEGLLVEAGIFEAGEHPGGEIDMASLGMVHEYGSPARGIPERSWMRSTFNEKHSRWESKFTKALSGVVMMGANVLFSMAAVGEGMASDLRRKITTLRTPPNSPLTIAKKGSSNPLIDTGAMRNSVRSRVRT